MLVLSRKSNQGVMIGDDIEIVVVAVQGDRVKLGFNAPGTMPIHREEIYQRIESEKDMALSNATGSALYRGLAKVSEGEFGSTNTKHGD